MLGMSLILAAIVAVGLVGLVLFFWVIALRRVVPVNEVHIVQTRKNTVSYGKGFASNTYYEWPSRIPLIGLQRVTLPVSNFAIDLPDYAAYDKERVPFLVHVMAFFRISDSNTCAQRVASFEELKEQLTAIVQGSVRTVLAAHEIDQIMLDRSRFGEAFTNLFLLDPTVAGVERTAAPVTDRSKVAHLELAGAPAELLGEDGSDGPRALAWTLDRALLGLCAMQLGVAEDAVRMAAEYTSEREQFGKPLSTFQGVVAAGGRRLHRHRRHATSRCGRRRGASTRGSTPSQEVAIAKWWAAEGGQQRRPRHPAPARRHGRRHRLPGPPLLPVGQADRRHARRRQRASSARLGDRSIGGGP